MKTGDLVNILENGDVEILENGILYPDLQGKNIFTIIFDSLWGVGYCPANFICRFGGKEYTVEPITEKYSEIKERVAWKVKDIA